MLLSALLAAAISCAAPRMVTPFNDNWTADGEPVTLPHTWNAKDGADGTPKGERGERYVAWKVNSASATRSYVRKAVRYKNNLPDPKPGRRYFFRCKGASVTAEVYVNNILIGRHLGAYSAFCYEITRELKAKGNKIVVYVDNRHNRDIPTLSADFTVLGGLAQTFTDYGIVNTPIIIQKAGSSTPMSMCLARMTSGASSASGISNSGRRRIRNSIRSISNLRTGTR